MFDVSRLDWRGALVLGVAFALWSGVAIALLPLYAHAVVPAAGAILRLVEPRAEDARTRQHYERQLGCSLSTAARLLGPHLVKSIALTGSDPYYRTGTDVAVLFETDRPALLSKMLAAQVGMVAASVPGAKVSKGKADGLEYRLVRWPDRAVCSYLVVLEDAVVLANSPHQLKRLAEVRRGQSPAITSTGEYRFFRDRYPLGDKSETALLLITDATIRRWCGPRWRIATSRRTRAAAMRTWSRTRSASSRSSAFAVPAA